MKIAVIGGGISGLAAAHRVTELLPDAELTVFEASQRLGGVLETHHDNGFLIERSADNFITKLPWAVDLCRRIGLEDQLQPTDETKRGAQVLREGKLHPIPIGFVLMSPGRVWPLLTTPILSWRGKLRLFVEPFVPCRRERGDVASDESVASFTSRRLGREAFERLVQPLLAGIYTADSEKLSMAATMPDLLALERSGHSLWRRPLAKAESGVRYGLFVAPRDGMASLVQAIAERLPAGSIQLGRAIHSLERMGRNWMVKGVNQVDPQPFDAVVVALPSYAAADLLHNCDQELANELSAIEYAGCAVVGLVYRRGQFPGPLKGFGFVVPQMEQRSIIAASYASEKFPGRAPADHLLIRVFLGGALRPEMLDRSDATLIELAHHELAQILGITGAAHRTYVARWPRSMPQYHVGHVERVDRIDARLEHLPGLELAGNAYRGVGIPQCVRSGERAAERVVEYLTKKAGET